MPLVSLEQVEQFQREGYFILESVIPENVVAALLDECMRLVDERDREMEAKGITIEGITHYKKRYFIHGRDSDSLIMTAFLFSELMAEICRATLGDSAYLFHEQYVVKAADTDSKFAWHQDSGYVGHYHRTYLSCWCALDDMTVENGTVYILPYSRDGRHSTDDIIDHSVEGRTNDKVGYRGDDPGEPAIVPAGSIVVFSSRAFHRSGPNMTDKYRRCYLAQYSAEPIMNRDDTELWGRAEPVLQNGAHVGPPN
jgi:ectoine hydroxylase-related dioxygenase (phytanoyl-CoA dioxygenase family)